ncbi:MAG: PspC domain-containing protein [Deltaproteobacteria bacterium]|jgi:phage shock protein C|nr:PspC domain-containing protein [Deltaproteobacteria bacterium]
MSLASLSIKGPFRSKRGLLLGVARGLAEHYQISAVMLRLVVVAVSLLLAFWPVVLLYIAAAAVMPAEPRVFPVSERDKEIVLLCEADPAALMSGLAVRADDVEKKVRRLEDRVTSRSFRVN